MWHIHGIFHPFKVDDLGAMVSIMTMLATKTTREFFPKVIVFVPPLAFVFISPLGVMVALVLVSPSRFIFGEVISPWSWVIIVLVFSFIFGIIQLMGQIFRIQLFKILKFLNGSGLNKINPNVWLSLWRSNGMWRTRK
jgi:hypothetical protein